MKLVLNIDHKTFSNGVFRAMPNRLQLGHIPLTKEKRHKWEAQDLGASCVDGLLVNT